MEKKNTRTKGGSLSEGVSHKESAPVKDMYKPTEKNPRMPKGHDRC